MPPHAAGRPCRTALALLALTLACNGGPTSAPERPPGETAEKTGSATDLTRAAPAPTPPPDPTATTERYASADGRISAPRPAGDAWECVEQTSEDPPAALIKCRQRDRSRFFFMMAKEYSVPAEEVRSLDGIVAEVLPQTYGKLFTSYKITRDEPTMVGAVQARDLWIEAEHASMGSIRKRERLMVQGERVYITSAEGLAAIFDDFAPAIDAWFAGAAFTSLR